MKEKKDLYSNLNEVKLGVTGSSPVSVSDRVEQLDSSPVQKQDPANFRGCLQQT